MTNMSNQPNKQRKKSYKYNSWRCRSDSAFRELFLTSIIVFYMFTDGIFNVKYMGQIFKTSGKFIRDQLIQHEDCAAILAKRRKRRHVRSRKQLIKDVIEEWNRDPDNIFIDDLGLRFNVPVISIQTILNRRPGACEEEMTMKRPLSFATDQEFYLRNHWKDEAGDWNSEGKLPGWGLKPKEMQELRYMKSYPWVDSSIDAQSVVDFFLNCYDMELTMKKFNVPTVAQLQEILNKNL